MRDVYTKFRKGSADSDVDMDARAAQQGDLITTIVSSCKGSRLRKYD